MNDGRAEFAARGGKEAKWEEAVQLGGGHDPGPDVCAALVMTADDVALLMPNPRAEDCLEPEHIYIQAAALVDNFRAEGPKPPWSRLSGGGYISTLANPSRVQ